MRFTLASAAVVALATQSVVANTWFGNAAYNKWHETELERWLSDHNVPYPSPADRKDLQDLVQKNWEDNVAKPYNSWDANQLQNYLGSKGQEVKKGTEKNKDSLLQQVQGVWHETTDQASDAYGSVQDWLFDSWTESQLKAFLDYHHVPNPSPRTRDSLLSTVRSNFQKAADKAGETAAYPGDWIYQSWSDSDLKAWLDERGIPNPNTGTRDKLIASVRRNARLASNDANTKYASMTKSAASAQQSLSDQLLASWSDSQIKDWCDKNGVKVPQGSKGNELKALAKKHAAQLSGDNASNSAASAYGAATTSAGNFFAQATNDAYSQARYWYDYALNNFGMASKEAKASLSSAASSASVVASKSSSSASYAASSAASSASKQASKTGGNASKEAAAAVKSATERVKQEL